VELHEQKDNGTRIGMFLATMNFGGTERVMLNLARGFIDRCLQVDLMLSRGEDVFLKSIPPTAKVLDFNDKRVLHSIPKLVRYLRRTRPAAILSASDHVNLVAIAAHRWARVPTRLVVSVHTTLSAATRAAQRPKERIIPTLARWLYPITHRVVCVSRGVADDLIRLCKLPAEKVEVIYNPVVTPDLLARSLEAVDYPWLTSKDVPIILSVGRLKAPKDFATLIRAFARVRQHYDARLIILGEGEARPALEQLVANLDLNNSVAMPGFVDNPYAWMRRADVFVLSSHREGFPLVLVEAMACSTPVIATDCPSGPREILEDGKWGKLVPVGDEAAMAEAICETLRGHSPVDPAIRAAEFHLDRALSSYLKVLGLE